MSSRFWRYLHCYTILQKPGQNMADHLLRIGGSITGNATCPNCFGTSS